MEEIKEIKPNTPIILFINNDKKEKLISVSINNKSRTKQCFIELYIDNKDGGDRKCVFRRTLSHDENFTSSPYPVYKNEKYLAIVSHCEVEVKIR